MRALAILAAFALAACSTGGAQLQPEPKAPAAGWTAVTDGNSYGAEVPASGSFAFPLKPASVHYVTEACPSLTGKTLLRLRYRIDAAPGVTFHSARDGVQVTSGPILYLQRAGDDWSGMGQFNAFRFWAVADEGSLAPGEHEIVARFTDPWNAVMTGYSTDIPAQFNAALANVARCGFTFPNDTGAGHGIYATGPATFTLIEFTAV